MEDFRCSKCNLLLGKIDGIAIIKCRKCGTINEIETKSAKSAVVKSEKR